MQALFTIWTKIRQTARQTIDQQSLSAVFVFYALGGIGSVMMGLIDSELYDTLSVPIILGICIVLGPISVIFMQVIVAAIVLLFGKIFKGKATFIELYKVLSLGYIPFIVVIPFYVVWLLVDPQGLMMPNTDPNVAISLLTIIVTIIMTIYSLVIYVISVSEAHRFGIWKSIFTMLIPSIIFFIIIVVVVVAIIALFVGLGSAL